MEPVIDDDPVNVFRVERIIFDLYVSLSRDRTLIPSPISVH